jgi:hypothetical protein
VKRMRGLRLFLRIVFLLPVVASAQTRDPLPVPNLADYKTLKCDFHLHTVFSDGEVWPTTRVAEAWRDGLDAIAITDHVDYSPHKEDIRIDQTRPFELARREADSLGLIIIPGIEIAEKDIHCNALFVKDPNAIKGGKLIESLLQARAQDAYVFWNHPGWKQTPQWFPLIASAYDQKLLQGMELVNGRDFYPEVFPWVDEKKLAIFADSDAHEPIPPASSAGTRPITLVFARTADVAGVRGALRERRTAAWMGGEVWGAEPYLHALWEGSVKVENSQIRLRPGGTETALRWRNDSAIPFRLRVIECPEWLLGFRGELYLGRQTINAQGVSLAKNAPVGGQTQEIKFEVVNFHIAPGKNLTVHVPLTIDVSQ